MQTLQIGDRWLEEEQGGLSRYYYELLRYLPATGVRSQGLVVGSAQIASTTHGQVKAFARPDESLLVRMRALRQMALRELHASSPDLIVSHFAIYALPIVDRLRSSPNVAHFHGPWAGESGVEGAGGLSTRMKSWVEQTVYQRATRLIVLSEAFRAELTQRYRIDESRIRIVPGGVDTERFNTLQSREAARLQLGWPTDRPILLSIRRHVRRMGLENLIEATALLRQSVPEVLVLLGGAGPISADLQQQIDYRNLTHSVRLVGRVPDADLPKAYRAADLTVVPTVKLEGFGLITLESLASGTPVYVTPIGGLSEVVRPFDPSCIFQGTSPEQIAATLKDALTGAQEMPSSEVCRRYAVDHFSWPRIAEKVRNVYQEACS